LVGLLLLLDVMDGESVSWSDAGVSGVGGSTAVGVAGVKGETKELGKSSENAGVTIPGLETNDEEAELSW